MESERPAFHRVLVVDDSEEFREAAAAWISSQTSLELVGTARDGQEALDEVERTRPSLVLMDAFMPGMDGFEATRRIKSRPDAPFVVILSVHDGETMEREAWAAGADAFVAKSDFARAIPDRIRKARTVRGAEVRPRGFSIEGGNA